MTEALKLTIEKQSELGISDTKTILFSKKQRIKESKISPLVTKVTLKKLYKYPLQLIFQGVGVTEANMLLLQKR